MATSAKCGNKQGDKKQIQKSPKRLGQGTKKKIPLKKVNRPRNKELKKPQMSVTKSTKNVSSKKTMGDLKSAYVALEYKHYHNIGSRRAAEQIITYDETVPIYQSLMKAEMFRKGTVTDCNSNVTDCNSNQTSTAKAGNCQVTVKDCKQCFIDGSIHHNSSQKRLSASCSTPSGKTAKCTSGKVDLKNSVQKKVDKKERRKEIEKKIKKTIKVKKIKPVLPKRREASLNASAKLNIFFHETEPIKGLDMSESSDEETLKAIVESLKDVQTKQDKKPSTPKKSPVKRKLSEENVLKKSPKLSPDLKKSGSNTSPSKSKKSCEKQKGVSLKNKKSKATKRSSSDTSEDESSPKYARRIASLNAEAIMAASGPEVPTNTQKAARTELLEAARTKGYVPSPRKELGRWIIGRGESLVDGTANTTQSSNIIQWTNRDMVSAESSVKDSIPVPAYNPDPLRINTSAIPSVERPPNPLCHSYQSPIHVNVEDCGPYINSHANASHIAAPLPRYPYTTPAVPPGSQCQSYTLGGLGSLSNVQMVPFHQTYNSAFTVPCNHAINVPCNHGSGCSLTAPPYYGYVHNNYYSGGSSLLQPMPEPPCLISRPPPSVHCPQGEVKVLIHNPHLDHPYLRQDDPAITCTASIKVEVPTPSISSAPSSAPSSDRVQVCSVSPPRGAIQSLAAMVAEAQTNTLSRKNVPVVDLEKEEQDNMHVVKEKSANTVSKLNLNQVALKEVHAQVPTEKQPKKKKTEKAKDEKSEKQITEKNKIKPDKTKSPKKKIEKLDTENPKPGSCSQKPVKEKVPKEKSEKLLSPKLSKEIQPSQTNIPVTVKEKPGDKIVEGGGDTVRENEMLSSLKKKIIKDVKIVVKKCSKETDCKTPRPKQTANKVVKTFTKKTDHQKGAQQKDDKKMIKKKSEFKKKTDTNKCEKKSEKKKPEPKSNQKKKEKKPEEQKSEAKLDSAQKKNEKKTEQKKNETSSVAKKSEKKVDQKKTEANKKSDTKSAKSDIGKPKKLLVPSAGPQGTCTKSKVKKDKPAIVGEEDGNRKEKVAENKWESPGKVRRRRDSNGWSWMGTPEEKMILTPTDSPAVARLCFPSITHMDGDVVNTGDCVLLCSGPRKSDVPYVAKVSSLWEADDGEMMMSLLWYYRPEHTETGRKPHHLDTEVFASKHRDENSVACIEDKCYVLTYNEFCRYRADLKFSEEGRLHRLRVVPNPEESYSRASRLPPLEADPEIVLLCRQVYDFRQKRILKNPS